MIKRFLNNCSFRTYILLFGIIVAVMPFATYTTLAVSFPEIPPFMVLGAALVLGIGLAIVGSSYIFRSLARIYAIADAAVQGRAHSGDVKKVRFSFEKFRNSVSLTSKMALLGHESIKGFRALPAPAILFDRNGIILSQSAGMQELLVQEFKNFRSASGNLFFVGEHISALLGQEKVKNLFKFPDVPLVIKQSAGLKVTATLCRLSEGASRKEAGLIMLNVERANAHAAAPLRISAPVEMSVYDESPLMAELKTTCMTIMNSFGAFAEFMHALAAGNFTQRVNLSANGDMGRLVDEANQFANHLLHLSQILTPRLASAQGDIAYISTNADEISVASAAMQQSLGVTFSHFNTSMVSDQNLAEIFQTLHQATGLMDSETRIAHQATIASVNQHTQLATRVAGIHTTVGVLEDLGFALKLLGLNAAVEAARSGQSQGMNELCKEIRALGQKFRSTASEFREWVEPLHELTLQSQQHMAVVHEAIAQIVPVTGQVHTQLQTQAQLVRAALKPRMEAAQHIEQALAHSRAVHETIVRTVANISRLAEDVVELFEVTSAVIPPQAGAVTAEGRTAKAASFELLHTADDESPDMSLDWFRRDILLRELSGDMSAQELPDMLAANEAPARNNSAA